MNHQLLQKLYETYGKEIYLYLCSLCGSRSMAEDLRQETFLKAILSLPENHTNMRAWLYMVARNLCFNSLKREKRLVSMEEMPEWGRMDDNTTDIADLLIADENIRILYQALSELKGQQREILVMHYFGRLTQKEIAAVLHLTPENVRVLSYRAKRELRSYMEGKGYDIS